MKVSDLARRVCYLEGGKVSLPIAQVSEVLKCVNRITRGRFYRWVHLIPVMLLVVCLAGCVSTRGAFGARHSDRVTFIDADGTNYEREILSPAGEVSEGAADMSLEITETGGYKLNIGQSGKTDTTAQASMMTAVAQVQSQAFVQAWQSALAFAGTAVEAAVPIFLKELDNALALGTIDAQSHAEISKAFMNWIGTLPVPVQPTTGSAPSEF